MIERWRSDYTKGIYTAKMYHRWVIDVARLCKALHVAQFGFLKELKPNTTSLE